jgi:very-short-patch-repair endonuclease
VIHRNQLLVAGISRHAIAHRLLHQRLFRIYADVFAVGRPKPDRLGREWAAVLYFDGYAILDDRTAGWMWHLTDAWNGDVAVKLVGRSGHSRKGLKVHQVADLPRNEIRKRWGLPVTSPARTIVDLAGSLDDELEIENVVARCFDQNLATAREIRAALDRTANAKGAYLLRQILANPDGPALTRSQRERLLRKLIKQAKLPQPISNTMLVGHEVDFHWPHHGLVVEFDGWGTHGTRQSFESDRERDQNLVAAGYRVIRFTWRQLENDPFAVIARIAAALAIHTSAASVA